ncbi:MULTISPECIES: hypothetical protein [Haloarcula]|jgi:hypothetical protein|uniref:Uncharacterized protein n=2 Tax=Haloarcula TaxID=2237 RepID=A0A8J8C9N4_9EURY|nr:MULTISPECIES: hypothetical protein [Halomicroarcula]MBX0288760.1 hypothetical protein [Halomicroarcula salinisoli]MBX0305532.1 hypothetical protein [Halomicroarcula salinisoli]MDS0283765.1 hypothetical protein [Halomicroarcula sp. S3CR25-11]
MDPENEGSATSHMEADQQKNPFGLSSPKFVVLVVLVGIIGPGLLVYTLEQTNLPAVADLVWILGYGTTTVVVWFIWLRPLDLVGPSAHDISLTEESEQSETRTDNHKDGSETANAVEAPVQDPSMTEGNTSQESNCENPETSKSR